MEYKFVQNNAPLTRHQWTQCKDFWYSSKNWFTIIQSRVSWLCSSLLPERSFTLARIDFENYSLLEIRIFLNYSTALRSEPSEPLIQSNISTRTHLSHPWYWLSHLPNLAIGLHFENWQIRRRRRRNDNVVVSESIHFISEELKLSRLDTEKLNNILLKKLYELRYDDMSKFTCKQYFLELSRNWFVSNKKLLFRILKCINFHLIIFYYLMTTIIKVLNQLMAEL